MANEAPIQGPTLTVEDAPGAARELKRLFTIFRRTLSHWRISAVIVALGVLAGVGVILVRKPSYRSETVVLYREGIRSSYLGQEGGVSMRTLGVRLNEMLIARPRLEAIIEEHGIYQQTRDKLGMVEAVDEFRKHIQFKARATDTFWIAYQGDNPDSVQAVTARLAESLIEENARLGIEQAKVQSEFIAAAKAQAEEELKNKERELASFLASHPEFALDQSAQSGTGAQGASIRAAAQEGEQLGDDPALKALMRQRQRAQALLDGTTSMPSAPNAAADPVLVSAQQQAQATFDNAQRQLAEAKAQYTDAHPDVQAAQAKVAKAQAELTKANQAVAKSKTAAQAEIDQSFESPAEAKAKAKADLGKIDAEIAERKRAMEKGKETEESNETVNRVVALETDWARLNREVSDARDRVDDLERKTFRAQLEASSAFGGYGDHIAVVDPAYRPSRPNPPGKSLILVLAFAASFAFSLVIALIRAIIDDRIHDVNDLARVAPVLAVVPKKAPKRWFKRD